MRYFLPKTNWVTLPLLLKVNTPVPSGRYILFILITQQGVSLICGRIKEKQNTTRLASGTFFFKKNQDGLFGKINYQIGVLQNYLSDVNDFCHRKYKSPPLIIIYVFCLACSQK